MGGCRQIFGVSDWPDFYQALDLTVPTRAALCTRLEEAIDRSWSKGYHGPARGPKAPGIVKLLQCDFVCLCQFKKQHEPEPKGDARFQKQDRKSKDQDKGGKESEKKDS